jgi:hypothetical protein
MAQMNRFKRLTSEYQQELQSLYSKPERKARPKLKVEPMSHDISEFDPKQHDFIVSEHQDGDKIGFIAVTHKKTGIMPFQFHVNQDYRRQKVGTRLAKKAEAISGGKPIIPSPDMTPAATAWLKSYHSDIIKKSIFEEETLIKSDDYAKKASTGVILLHPISINGKTHRSNGVPMHMTVKSFGDNTQIDPREVQQHLEKFSIPSLVNEKNMLFMPHVLQGPNNAIHHVLLVYGAPPHVDQIRKGSQKYGQHIQNFLPHISVDKEDWDKFAKMGPILTSDKVGIKIHSAELKSGPQVVKRY